MRSFRIQLTVILFCCFLQHLSCKNAYERGAIIVSDKLAAKFKPGEFFKDARNFGEIRAISDDIEKTFQKAFSGYRVDPKQPFTFRIYSTAEFAAKSAKEGGFKVLQ